MVFVRQYPLVCDLVLDFVHGCSFCCSWSADVQELMALTSAWMRHLARDAKSIEATPSELPLGTPVRVG
jgi:hypothetical protein